MHDDKKISKFSKNEIVQHRRGIIILVVAVSIVLAIYLSFICGQNKTNSGNEGQNESQKIVDVSSNKEMQKQVQIQQQVEAEYEKWLASAVVMGVSIEYPDFELIGIYTKTCTKLEDSQSSKGVYVLFKSDGKNLAVYSMPLNQERTDAETIDISTKNMGMATFDLVDSKKISTEGLKTYSMDQLEKTISQTMQFSMYYH